MTTQPRTAVITGASSGIGLAAAKALAGLGWRIIIQGRDQQRSAAAERQVIAEAGDVSRVTMLRADLSLLREAARLAQDIADLTDRIDVLILNAGGLSAEESISDEGIERTFAANHLSHFLIVQRLLPQLRSAARDGGPGTVRILTVSSRAHAYPGEIDWADLNRSGRWDTMGSYAQAKLFNILHARELARQLQDDGIVAHSMHPGIVDTNFPEYGGDQLRAHFAQATLTSPDDAAKTLVWLATAEEPGRTSGRYYFESAPEDSAPISQDPTVAARLWDESEKLIDLAGF